MNHGLLPAFSLLCASAVLVIFELGIRHYFPVGIMRQHVTNTVTLTDWDILYINSGLVTICALSFVPWRNHPPSVIGEESEND